MGLPSVAVGAGGREQAQQACLDLPICALVAGKKPLFKARTGPKREAYAGTWPGALYEFLAEDQQVSPRRELWSVIGEGPARTSTLSFALPFQSPHTQAHLATHSNHRTVLVL